MTFCITKLEDESGTKEIIDIHETTGTTRWVSNSNFMKMEIWSQKRNPVDISQKRNPVGIIFGVVRSCNLCVSEFGRFFL